VGFNELILTHEILCEWACVRLQKEGQPAVDLLLVLISFQDGWFLQGVLGLQPTQKVGEKYDKISEESFSLGFNKIFFRVFNFIFNFARQQFSRTSRP
jgi:hypothetical protein